MTGRIGRYPRADKGGCPNPQLILDTNPPDTDHWWYVMAERDDWAALYEACREMAA